MKIRMIGFKLIKKFFVFILVVFTGYLVNAQEKIDTIKIDHSQRNEPDTVVNVDIHPQDSPEDRGFLIESKDMKSSLRIRGSIRLNGGFDLNGLQTKSTFSTYDIPVGDANIDEVRFFMNINQTRLGLEASKETPVGDAFMRIEIDFMGSNNVPRLRHVYGSTKRFLVGQTWSVFGDVSSLPNTVDLDGPNSAVAERTVQIRYNNYMKGDISWAVSIESPNPDISYPDSVQIEPAFQSFPDVATRFKKHIQRGHFQVAGILRSINGKDVEGETSYLAGFGLLLSGHIKTNKKVELLFQGFAGKAISRFINGITGRGLDVIYSPDTDKFETLGSGGGFISFGYTWKPLLYSQFTAGSIKIFNKTYQPDDAMSFSYYFSGNLFWDTKAGTRTGIEYSWGRRTNKDFQHGNANRISFIFFYDF